MLRRRVLVFGGLLIIGFWLVMMTILLRREVFTPFFRSERSPFTVPKEPTDVWFGLFLNDAANTPIGYINIQMEPTTHDRVVGVQTRVLGRMRLNLGIFQGELVVSGGAWASPIDGLHDFSFTLRSGRHVTSVDATLENGRIKGVINTGGEMTPIDLAVGNTQLMTNMPGFGAFTMPLIDVGEEVLVEAFDPLTMSAGNARVRCIGEETIEISGKPVKTKLFLTNLSGMKSNAWVDAAGEVLRAETPIGFVLQRMDEKEALRLSIGAGDNGGGLLEFAAIRPQGPAPFRGATYMRVELEGLVGIAQLPADHAQTPGQNGALVIAPKGSADDTAPLADVDLADTLANDSFLQIDHPKIMEKAREIAGNETDRWKKAQLIYDWVYTSVKKNIVPSLPAALDVLDTMEGDCNEHTMLYTALARASGVPTRMAIGIVWSEEFKAFYYHAWPEVYAGRWVWVDPTLGQPIADATHIKLISGDLMTWWRIAPFMGNMKLRILEVR